MIKGTCLSCQILWKKSLIIIITTATFGTIIASSGKIKIDSENNNNNSNNGNNNSSSNNNSNSSSGKMTATAMMICVTLTRILSESNEELWDVRFRVMESLTMVPFVLVVDLESSNQTIVKINYGCSENIKIL